MITQGITSKNYYIWNMKIPYDAKFEFEYKKYFQGISYTYRYDVPTAFNEKFGTVYSVFLFDSNNELIATGERHPINGESLTVYKYDSFVNDKFWDYYKDLTMRVCKNENYLQDKYKVD
jgi:hypothetical protein